MTRRLAIGFPFVLAACMACEKEAAPEPTQLSGPTGEASCPADEYQGFVGSQLAAVTYPSDLDVRIIEPGMMVTMDYDPERMNIRVDEEGVITEVRCG